MALPMAWCAPTLRLTMFLLPAAPSIPLALSGAAVATIIAFLARRAGSLNTSGAIAAVLVGTASFASGWEVGVVLLVFFISSSALSRFRHARKLRLTERLVAKTGARDAWQVLANGGVFALLALSGAICGQPRISIAALAAIAAANGDTWATEIGVLMGRPRSAATWKPVPPGTSGAVSIPGTIAGIAGVLLMTATSFLLGIDNGASGAIVAGGIAGLMFDSLLGATLQSQRWCATCRELTERRVHICGTETTPRRGIRLLENDGVNALATIAGAMVAWFVA